MAADVAVIADGLRALADRVVTLDVPTVRELTAYYVKAVVRLHGGNKTRAAKALGISLSTVAKLLKTPHKPRQKHARLQRDIASAIAVNAATGGDP